MPDVHGAVKQHNLGLDLVRSAAILLVLYSHTEGWWVQPSPATTITTAYAGRIGVELFFSLSGFLIGGILLRGIEAGFGPAALVRFWSRRWMRTLPAYWVMLGLLGSHFAVFDWRSLLFLQNWAPRQLWTPLTPHTWSLALEEWFYLFVPALLLGAVRALGRRRRHWAVPLACLALVVACSAGRAVVGTAAQPFWGPDPGLNPVLRLDCAAWGLLAAWLVHRRPLATAAAWALAAAGTSLLLLMGWVWAGVFTPERLVPWGFHLWGAAWEPLHPALEEAGAACLVLALHRLLPGGSAVPGSSMMLGDMLAWAAGGLAALSYALYLVHIPILYLLRGAGLDDAAGWGARAAMAAAILSAALALRWGVERPALALRERLAPERPVPAAPAAIPAGLR